MSEMNKLELNIECPLCGEVKKILLTTEEYINYIAYQCGQGLIQEMLPNVPAPERELLAGGMCGECWKKNFSFPFCEDENENDGNTL